MNVKAALLMSVVAFTFVFTISALQAIEVAEASHCPAGAYATYCRGSKYWCSNKDRDPSPYECGCTCSTASCQDGNTLTTNTCAGSYCSSSSCPAGFADTNNNPSDGCETSLFDFTNSIDPTSGTLNKGDTRETTSTLTKTAGNAQSVSFSSTGVPIKTRTSFSPTSCTPNTVCTSQASLILSRDTPNGAHSIGIVGTSGSLQKTATYSLTVLQGDVNATCGNLICETGETSLTCASDCDASCTNNGACSLTEPTTCSDCSSITVDPLLSAGANCGNGVCASPETQKTCSADCKTTTTIPSPVAPGEVVSIDVEFYDFRYTANQKVKIDIVINPEGTAWTSANGCSFAGQKMGPTAGTGNIAWPAGTVSESGHFKISTTCTMPSTITAGAKTLVATPTIY